MDIRERLFQELEILCKVAGLDFEKRELSEFIGPDEVIDYYIAQGPFPDFPDTVFDVYVLTDKYLCDFEMRQQGSLHHVLPLSRINEIAESFSGKEKDFLSVEFRIAGFGGGLVLQGKLGNKEHLRRFSSRVKGKLIERLAPD